MVGVKVSNELLSGVGIYCGLMDITALAIGVQGLHFQTGQLWILPVLADADNSTAVGNVKDAALGVATCSRYSC